MEHELLEQRSASPNPKAGAQPAATEGGRAGAVLALQRTAGNSAVVSMIGAPPSEARAAIVQREGLDDVFGPNPFGGQEGGTETEDGGPAAATPGGVVELGPMARTGVLFADTVVATSVVASSYTPGAGNIM